MKLIAALLFSLTFFNVNSQDFKDTILVNSQNTVYLVFPSNIDFVDVGQPEKYFVKVEGNTVFLKSSEDHLPFSTILIRYQKQEKDFHGLIKATKNVKQYYYDFKTLFATETLKEESKINASENTGLSAATKKAIDDKRKMVEGQKNEFNTLGVISDYIDAAVTCIRNDKEYTYLKIILNNKTSIPYKLDFISFQYIQDLKKGFLRKRKKNAIDVFPTAIPEMKEIAENTVKVLGYAIPSYALSNNGYLLISFREKAGDRVLKIRIKSLIIQKSPFI